LFETEINQKPGLVWFKFWFKTLFESLRLSERRTPLMSLNSL